MAIELTVSNDKVLAVYRFIGKEIYVKSNNPAYANSLIEQIRKKGGKIVIGMSWIKCDLIGDNQIAKLGNTEIDITIDNNDTIEQKFFDFFKMTLEKAGFKIVSVKKL